MENNIGLDSVGAEDVLSPSEYQVILSNLTDELLLENIFEQIETPVLDLYDPTNFVNVFESRYTFLKSRFREVQDFVADLETAKLAFYTSVYEKICRKFGLLGDIGQERLYIGTRVLYDFFVLGYKDNIETFFVEYVKENKKALAASFDEGNKNLDLVSLKKMLKNKTDALILSNVYRIVDLIIQQKPPAKNVLEMIVQTDPAETSNYFIDALLVKGDQITASEDFSDRFFSVLATRGDGYTKILNGLQMQLLDIFPKKSADGSDEE